MYRGNESRSHSRKGGEEKEELTSFTEQDRATDVTAANEERKKKSEPVPLSKTEQRDASTDSDCRSSLSKTEQRDTGADND